MVLVDTSSRPEDKAHLELACRNADVIMLCFDSGPQEICQYHSIVLRSRGVSQQTGGKQSCRFISFLIFILSQHMTFREGEGRVAENLEE